MTGPTCVYNTTEIRMLMEALRLSLGEPSVVTSWYVDDLVVIEELRKRSRRPSHCQCEIMRGAPRTQWM